ncbi:Uncharacterised protein [[Clostridium] sordellii]|uniref:hypothetical protein n=1 Tax=Paraclostridium sordellii TaxID=1505 RepID=UPI0005E1EE69|nr:hypothetical protein [Paeniclostridium sordellii]CEQ01614.1 Uncharacterised protein [[Clostridium] sordellii] [Paeniclostridium sordellii]
MEYLDKLKSASEAKDNTIKSYLYGMREDTRVFSENLCEKVIENINKNSSKRKTSFKDRFPTQNRSVLELFELMYKDEIHKILIEKDYKVNINRYHDQVGYGIEVFVSWK